MLYHAYEMTHAAITPMRAAARLSQEVIRNPLNPMAEHYGARAMSAALEMFINATRRYGKPEWEIETTTVDGEVTPVSIETVGGEAVLRPAALPARRHREAQRSRRSSSSRRSRGITRRCCAGRCARSCPSTRSTSPTGSMRGTCR
jgi:poly-beta-hydroxyalkanoate depolymerase